jgi:hypothetical protein
VFLLRWLIPTTRNLASAMAANLYHAGSSSEGIQSAVSTMDSSHQSFRSFVWSLRMPYLWILLILLPFEFLLFKIQYPYPNFRGDSSAYVAAAVNHLDATEWPVGYSKFLEIIHFFTHSDTSLVSVQFLLIEGSALFFLFTLAYFVRPGRLTFNILFVFLMINPLFLHFGNYIMSDGLFITLSLLWFAQLIWILYRPSALQIVSQAFLLLSLFAVRYNAIFYPVISAVAFILSRQRLLLKISGILAGIFLITLFIGYTEHAYYKSCGIQQFSPFGGWQLANNALYMYSNLPLEAEDRVPARFHELDSMVRDSFDSAQKHRMALNPYIKDYYTWNGSSPLMRFLKFKWRGDTTTNMLIKWESMGPLFSAYGSYLVKKYPLEYFRYYVVPNMGNFFEPLIGDLGYYNQGNDRLKYWVIKWFDYKEFRIPHFPANSELDVMKPYPFLINLFNIGFLGLLILYFCLKEFRSQKMEFNQLVIVTFGFWLLNFCFSSMSNSIMIRYQIFQFILCFSFTLILSEKLFLSKPIASEI